MKFTTLKKISKAIADKDLKRAGNLITKTLETETKIHWIRDLNKLLTCIETGKPQFKILARDGNSKLPFLAFSSLPGVGHCPGAGDCLNFCYSFRSWRYPSSFCRQAQNSILMQTNSGFDQIKQAIEKYKPKAGSIDFRLYVDGDFSSAGNVLAWMGILEDNPWLNCYGYSKSWNELLQYSEQALFPDNYKLNLSSGSMHGKAITDKVKALSITRGEFKAVSVGYKVTSKMHNDRAHQRELRLANGNNGKVFTCPGKCGTCTPKGHACGSDRFKGIDIIIAVH